MALDQIFGTKLMVMGHILIPKPIQGCTHICKTGVMGTPGGTIHIGFS